MDVVGRKAAAPLLVAFHSLAPLWAQRVDAHAVALRAWLLAFWVPNAAAYSEVMRATNAFPATIPHDAWLTTVVTRAVIGSASCHVLRILGGRKRPLPVGNYRLEPTYASSTC